MTLLEAIIGAAAEAEEGVPSEYPIVLNPDDIFLQLKPDDESPGGVSLVKRVSGWKISETDAAISELASHFAQTLRNKLKRPKSFGKGDFLGLLNSFLTKSAEKIGLSIGSDAADESSVQFSCSMIEKMGFLIGGEVARLIAECCAVLEVWEMLETLLLEGLIGHLKSTNLVEKLVEKNQPELLCLLVKHVSDLQSSELLAILKYFLSPTDGSYDGMVAVRRQWETEALSAIEKATTQAGLPKKVSRLAREASVLLMMAHDGFLSYEVCLHYVFGSSNGDGIMLSAAIAKLDGEEVLYLIRYFLKWLRKYHRFPEACPCPSAGATLGLRTCESVPSLESVVKGLGLVLDEHFSYLVFNSEFHAEMRAAENIINSLVLEANQSCPLGEIIRQLLSEIQKK
ncbi:hypothetical protein Cni_G14629 [Canna indica]|uniref:Uncharacterized protein n=1 Tax=Canna indica TaxID=4628 RepID=A0AAQ3KBT5_9LILI|nr:hypothetical protein Cni_G14629 [Canna indica]